MMKNGEAQNSISPVSHLIGILGIMMKACE
jgi:hypothetical protein